MEKEFVPYKLALKMKQLGFDEPCFGYFESQDKNLVINYNNKPLTEEQQKRPGLYIVDNRNDILPQWAVAAPLYQQAFRWFREKYNIHTRIEKYDETKWWANWGSWTSEVCDTYEEAELACLEKLIEIIELKKKIKHE
jgi:hypothetical protein